MVIKKSQATSKSSAKTTKSSAKKNITGNKTKTVKKPKIKKPVKDVKAPGTKLSSPKTAAKPAVTKSGLEIKKLIKTIDVKKAKKVTIAVKKPSVKKVSKVVARKTEGKTAQKIKAPAKTVSAAKKEKKSTVKREKAAGSKVTPNKTIKPVSTKKPSARKVSKVVVRKAKGKTAQKIKAIAKTVSAEKKEKKSTVKTVKTGLQKKSAISSTIPQIKETVKQKTGLKPKEKTEAPLSAIRKTVKKKGTSSLITTKPLPAISKKTTATNTIPPQAETIPKKTAKLKVFLPEEELPPEEAQQAPFPKLPEEYGENELLLMEVDPSIVFVSWEIKPDDISGETGKLTLRVYDVTGLDFDVSPANRFFDIPLRKRVDSKFIDIKMPGRDVIMEVGLLGSKGAFKTIKRSNRVSMPILQTFEGFGITRSLSDPDTIIGY